MMEWNNLAPDIRVRKLSDFIVGWNLVDSIRAISTYLIGKKIFIKNDCLESIIGHLSSSTHELGGILLGSVVECDMVNVVEYNYLTFITHVVRSEMCENSSVSLRMGLDVWQKASALLNQDHLVLGWYHSHPNLGAFFSGTDRATQLSFFNNDYSVGLVIDPYRKEQKCFVGRDAREFRGVIEVLSEDLPSFLI